MTLDVCSLRYCVAKVDILNLVWSAVKAVRVQLDGFFGLKRVSVMPRRVARRGSCFPQNRDGGAPG